MIYLHNFFLRVGLKLVFNHLFLSSLLREVGQSLDRRIVCDRRLEDVENAGAEYKRRMAGGGDDTSYTWVSPASARNTPIYTWAIYVPSDTVRDWKPASHGPRTEKCMLRSISTRGQPREATQYY